MAFDAGFSVSASASLSGSASLGVGLNAGATAAGDALLPVFRFRLSFTDESLGGGGGPVELVGGAFSNVTGLEATMEPKTFREGGRNFGAVQRAGAVSFATVILKRGLTPARDLWRWFDLVGSGAYAYRLGARIEVLDGSGNPQLAWRLLRALPVKFRAAELDARASQVGIEELHLVHEGLERAG